MLLSLFDKTLLFALVLLGGKRVKTLSILVMFSQTCDSACAPLFEVVRGGGYGRSHCRPAFTGITSSHPANAHTHTRYTVHSERSSSVPLVGISTFWIYVRRTCWGDWASCLLCVSYLTKYCTPLHISCPVVMPAPVMVVEIVKCVIFWPD